MLKVFLLISICYSSPFWEQGERDFNEIIEFILSQKESVFTKEEYSFMFKKIVKNKNEIEKIFIDETHNNMGVTSIVITKISNKKCTLYSFVKGDRGDMFMYLGKSKLKNVSINCDSVLGTSVDKRVVYEIPFDGLKFMKTSATMEICPNRH